jgi:hypothetical protein
MVEDAGTWESIIPADEEEEFVIPSLSFEVRLYDPEFPYPKSTPSTSHLRYGFSRHIFVVPVLALYTEWSSK